MKFVSLFFITVLIVLDVSGLSGQPVLSRASYADRYRRPLRSLHPSMIMHGYYARPIRRGANFVPQGTMTAFAAGDTIAAESYLGGHSSFNGVHKEVDLAPITLETPIIDLQPGEETDETFIPQAEPEPPQKIPVLTKPDDTEEPTTGLETKPKSRPKPTKKVPVDTNEEDDEDDDSDAGWPFNNRGSKTPNYNAFFPIMFSGIPGFSEGRKGSSGGGSHPGLVTAIANSFSTGKRGVATSHATSFGSGYLDEKRKHFSDSRN